MGVGFETQEEEGGLRIVLSGDLDVSTAGSVEERLIALEEDVEPSLVVLDLRDLFFIDSTGLSLLINAHGRARKAGRHLRIVSGSGPPRRILETTGLTGRLDVVENGP